MHWLHLIHIALDRICCNIPPCFIYVSCFKTQLNLITS